MADVFSPQKRSEIMSRVKGRGNRATEMRLLSVLRDHNIKGWRRNSLIVGKPDFVFPKQRVAVFVDGCFWHGCPLHGQIPASNRKFWSEKLARNQKRDRFVRRELRKRGWRIHRVWQHELGKPAKVARNLQRLMHTPFSVAGRDRIP